MQYLEHLIERGLWRSRLLMVVAVGASIVLALGAIFMATIDVVSVFGGLARYADGALTASARSVLRDEIITNMVKAVDGYLIAAIMVILGLGIYELFVNRIDPAQRSETAARLLQIRNLDDLKDRLAKLILLVLIVEFFQYALQVSFTSALDLLYLALGILLIGGAIYLTKDKGQAKINRRSAIRQYASERRIARGSDHDGKDADLPLRMG